MDLPVDIDVNKRQKITPSKPDRNAIEASEAISQLVVIVQTA